MTVRYEAVNAMLLNKFLKAHKKIEEQEAMLGQIKATITTQEATIAQLNSTVAQQQDFQAAAVRQQPQIEALTDGLRKVSTRLELTKPSSQRVADN
jgi:uncharacterized coiled-coil protein SlyX